MINNLYTIVARKEVAPEGLTKSELFSLLYHDLFDYPLNTRDIIRWNASGSKIEKLEDPEVSTRGGFYFLKQKEGLVYKRLLRKRISAKKLGIAQKAANILALVPWIKMIAVTGSLAMENSSDESDIDLMIVTQKGMLWTTRAFAYIVIHAFGLSARKPNDLQQKDKLCLNIWLDEGDLVWDKRSFYTAHEIAQIVPLINKDQTYERFLYKNKWILGYWPSAVVIKNLKLRIKNSTSNPGLIERVCYWIQRQYMNPKITREVVTPTRALFHPQDWGKVVLDRLARV